MRHSVIALVAATALLLGNTDPNFNAAGYRVAHVRGPVSRSPEGAPRIAVPAAISLWRAHDALFIDVLPAEGAVTDPRTGAWKLANAHSSIPGAVWFPGAGSGDLAPATAHWFEHGVARLTHGHMDRMLVVFCQADCWLSWNAARRLAALGYRNVWWLAEGVGGWREAGMPFAPVTPQPISATSDNR